MAKKSTKLISAVICAVMICCILVPSALAQTEEYYTVKSSTLNLRKAPSTSAGRIVRLGKGTLVVRVDQTLTTKNGYEWIHIRDVASGTEGYVAKKYLNSASAPGEAPPATSSAAPQEPGKTAAGAYGYYTVKASALNLRAAATTNSAKVKTFGKGALLERIDASATKANGYTWFYVCETATGAVGYVASKYLTQTTAPVSQPAPENPGNAASDPEEDVGEEEIEDTLYYKVTASKLNLRAAATTGSAVVTSFTRGAILERLDETEVKANGYTWFHVKSVSAGQEGYVAGCFVANTDYKPGEYEEVGEDPSTGRTYVTYRQGSTEWGFSKTVRKKACWISSCAMVLANMGYSATPRTVYDVNGKSTSGNIARIAAAYNVNPVSAVASDSAYFSSFSEGRTYIKSPGKNAEAALKEAIDRNPEGVLVYFVKGSAAHAVVAVTYDARGIIYCDPGRTKGSMLTFAQTWCVYNHRMSYSNLSYMVALDPKV